MLHSPEVPLGKNSTLEAIKKLACPSLMQSACHARMTKKIRGPSIYRKALWLFEIAMEHCPFIDHFIIYDDLMI